MTNTKTIEKMTFEQALSELESIVKTMDQGDDTLDNIIKNFEHGVALKKHCVKILSDAKMKIDKISQNDKGETILSDLEV